MPAQKLSNSQTGQGSDDPSDNFVYEDEGTALNGPKKTDLKISVLSQTENAASFAIEGEDHTLGNALRWIIMKNPAVELCGYSIPHPAEDKMHIRIQTWEGTAPVEALEKGLDDLMDLCDVVSEKFDAAKRHVEGSGQPRRRG